MVFKFEDVWKPKYEQTSNLNGVGIEAGVRALHKKASKDEEILKRTAAAGGDPTVIGEIREARLNEAISNPGQNFERLSFTLQQPLKDRADYVGVGRKFLLTDLMPNGDIPARLLAVV